MAQALGLSSFEELREPFRRALLTGVQQEARADWLSRLREDGITGGVQAEAAANTLGIVGQDHVGDLLRGQDTAEMEKVADMILSADAAYVTATRATYALAYFLHYVGRMAAPSLQLIPRHMNSPIDELRDTGPQDVLLAITFSPYSRETIEACAYARNRGARLILISDSDVVAPELKPEATLVAATQSTHHFGCFSGAMALIEGLIAVLVARGGQQAEDRIGAYDRLRNEIDAYWRRPKKQ
jgi:DNA-binding MurR/RpiR family transcriptional regulator